jgi:electron transfer flavoprotein alpha subunit
MAGHIWVMAEIGDGGLARISTEVATLARSLAEQAGRKVSGVVVGADPEKAAKELARYLPRVVVVNEPATDGHAGATIVAERVASLAASDGPDYVLLGAGPEGRDTAGVLSALLGWPVLANATGLGWRDDGPTVEMSVFGGKLNTTSAFTGGRGIITVRPNAVAAEPASSAGKVEKGSVADAGRLPQVSVVDSVVEPGAAAPIEEARVVVAGGRGVGGEDGFKVIQELADALGGVVGATRAAVDAGWINYAHQIGQTGKIVKPQLYLALGISGAIQHKVGMQTAETIVAVNRDADAPIAEFADLLVVGDLFEIAPAITAALRARTG